MPGSRISSRSPSVLSAGNFLVILFINASMLILSTQPVEGFLPIPQRAILDTYRMSATIQGDACSPKCDAAASLQEEHENQPRRSILRAILAAGATTASAVTIFGGTLPAMAEESIFAPKFVQEYPDFQQTDEGWSYKDVKIGNGDSPKTGDRVVYEWSGYTIGYFGRPFEAKGGPKGGAFDKDLDYSRAVLGSGSIVKGLDCAFTSMQPGGIRQVIVPYGELGYPADDANHDRVGPKPTTFSGMRALNFVLDNPRVDRTMLFNVKLVRIDRPDGKGGFLRGDKERS